MATVTAMLGPDLKPNCCCSIPSLQACSSSGTARTQPTLLTPGRPSWTPMRRWAGADKLTICGAWPARAPDGQLPLRPRLPPRLPARLLSTLCGCCYWPRRLPSCLPAGLGPECFQRGGARRSAALPTPARQPPPGERASKQASEGSWPGHQVWQANAHLPAAGSGALTAYLPAWACTAMPLLLPAGLGHQQLPGLWRASRLILCQRAHLLCAAAV